MPDTAFAQIDQDTHEDTTPKVVDLASVERRLKAILDENESSQVVVGQIHLKNLDEIARRIGPQWRDLRGEISRLMGDMVTSAMSTDDAVQSKGILRYVVHFAQADETTAHERLQALSSTIKESFSHLLADLGGIEMEIDAFAARIRISHLRKDGSMLVDRLLALLTGIKDGTENHRSSPELHVTRRMPAVFMPVLHMSSMTTGPNRCTFESTTREQIDRRIARIGDREERTMLKLDLDKRLLARATGAVAVQRRGQTRTDVFVPVSLDTLRDEGSRTAYIEAVREILPQYKQNLYIELCGVDERESARNILVARRILAPHFDRFAVELPLDAMALKQLGHGDVDIVSIDMHGLSTRDHKTIPELAAFVANSRKIARAAMAHNVNTIGLIEAGIRARFDLMDGPAIQYPQTTPGKSVKISKSMLTGTQEKRLEHRRSS